MGFKKKKKGEQIKKKTQKASNADWYWKIQKWKIWKADVPQKHLCQDVKEEIAPNVDPKTSTEVQQVGDNKSFFFSGLFSALGIYCDIEALGN